MEIGVEAIAMMRRLAAVAALALVAATVSGCVCKPVSRGEIARFAITINLDESLKDSSMVVDLVGVNTNGLRRLEDYSMTQYWKDGDPMRKDADKVTFSFLDGKKMTETLPKTHTNWPAWEAKGVTHIVVLSNLPGTHPDKPGRQDARRATLWLNKCKWASGTTGLTVRIRRSGPKISPSRPGW